MLTKATVATALLAAVSVASPAPPAPRSSVVKRFEEGFDCTGDTVASSGTPGLFIAIDSDGITLSCEDAAEASSERYIHARIKLS